MKNLIVKNKYDEHNKFDVYHINDGKIVKEKKLTKLEILQDMSQGIKYYAFSLETMQYEDLQIFHQNGRFYLRTDDKKLAEDSMFLSYQTKRVDKKFKDYSWAGYRR